MTAPQGPPALVLAPPAPMLAPPAPVPSAAALVLTKEADQAIVAARGEYEQRLDRLARLHCATTASNLLTGENVRQAKKLLESEPPGLFWLALDVVATVLLGAGINFATGDKYQSIGVIISGVAALLALTAKLSTHWAPYSEWWREKVRVRRP